MFLSLLYLQKHILFCIKVRHALVELHRWDRVLTAFARMDMNAIPISLNRSVAHLAIDLILTT